MRIPRIAVFWGDRYNLLPMVCGLLGFFTGFLRIVHNDAAHTPISPLAQIVMGGVLGILTGLLWSIQFPFHDGVKVALWFGIGFLAGFSHHHPIEYFMFLYTYFIPIVGLYFLTRRHGEHAYQAMDALVKDLENLSRKHSKPEDAGQEKP